MKSDDKSSVRVHLAQIEVVPGRPDINTGAILEAVETARRDGARLVAFPEMAVPGYLVGDAWERESFLRECEACGEEIRRASAGGPVIVFGNVAVDWRRRNEDGRVRKYNACFVASGGRFAGPERGPYPFVVKTLMPNYREFDDSRHFYDSRKLAIEGNVSVNDTISPVRVDGLSLGCVLCEDAWDADYGVSPLDILGRSGIDMAVNISCSPFTMGKDDKRRRVFSAHAARLRKPLLYVNNVGIQNNGKTVFVFDGGSRAYDPNGALAARLDRFAAGTLALDAPFDAARGAEPDPAEDAGMADLCRAILYGTGCFMRQNKAERIVVGVSGGIDSALVAALYSRIVSRGDLLLVNMPGRHNSPTTIELARRLAGNMGALYAEIPIDAAVDLTAGQIDGLEAASADGVLRRSLKLDAPAMENVQARDRSSRILAAVAAAFGGVFTCNSNKTEAAAGYCTFYGDLCGYFANIADLWKGEVYELAEHLNKNVFGREVIPAGCFTLKPSAELGPEQNVDENKGDPFVYPYHDRLFAAWVEAWNRATPEDILEWYERGELEERIGYSGRVGDIFPTVADFTADLEKWWGMHTGLAVAKRVQAPPVLAVKRRAFGFDLREAIMPPCLSRRYSEIKSRLPAAQALKS